MVWSNIGRAATTFVLVFAGQPEFVLALVFLRASVDSFYGPAKQSAIQSLADKSELMATNSLSQVINQASKLAGPAIGGALLLFVSSQMVFVINGFVSLSAALVLFALPRRMGKEEPEDDEEGAETGEQTGILSEIAEGYKTVGRIPALWITIMLGAFGFFAMFLHDTLIGPVTKQLGFDQSVLGLSITAVGAGGVLGALALGSIKRDYHPFVMIGPGMAIAAGFTLLLGFAANGAWLLPVWLFVSAFFVVGFVSSAVFVPMRTVLQLETPPDKMGRVTAVNEAVTVIAMMGAPFIGAILATNYGLGLPFLLGGGLSLVLGLSAVLLIPIVKFKKAEADTTDDVANNGTEQT